MKRLLLLSFVSMFFVLLNAFAQDQDIWIEQEWENEKWNNKFRDVYTYENDLLSVLVFQAWENGDWENKTRFMHEYDSEGREISYLIQFHDDQGWYDYMKDEYFYEDGKLVKYVLWYGGENHEDLEVDSEVIFTYNQEDLLIKKETYRWDMEEKILWEESTLKYDAKDRQTEELIKNYDYVIEDLVNNYKEIRIYQVNIEPPTEIIDQKWEDDWVNMQREIFTYGDDNLWDEHTVQSWNTEWINQSKRIKIRNEDMLETELISQYWSEESGWVNNTKRSSEYDTEKRLIRRLEEIYADSEWFNDLEHLYYYRDGRRYLILDRLWSEDMWINDTRNFLDGWLSINNKSADDLKLRAFPNPATSEINLHYNLEKPSLVIARLHNTAGGISKVISSEYQTAGENHINIDLHDLPVGSYLLQFVINGDTFLKKIMIVR